MINLTCDIHHFSQSFVQLDTDFFGSCQTNAFSTATGIGTPLQKLQKKKSELRIVKRKLEDYRHFYAHNMLHLSCKVKQQTWQKMSNDKLYDVTVVENHSKVSFYKHCEWSTVSPNKFWFESFLVKTENIKSERICQIERRSAVLRNVNKFSRFFALFVKLKEDLECKQTFTNFSTNWMQI